MSKRKLLIVFFAVFFLVVSLFINFIRKQYVAPILMYHSVNPKAAGDNRLIITDKAFDLQMWFLKKHHYNVLPLEELTKLIKEKKKVPPGTLAITLDDGYKDNYDFAFPILKKYNFPATMFIIINEVGRAQNDRLSWEQIKEMQASGLISFGSHALGPEPLINIKSEEELRRQISFSKEFLEKELGSPVTMFSYPEGLFNPKIRQLVIDATYKLAVATSPGIKFANDDLFALKRLRISSTSDNLFVFWIESSGFYTFIKEHRDD